ncbi:hypothetical protein E2C01_086681 [Portunus trituberculatus]|uniref:Uncharacterized protein n=1 Tax=Portunus trituberculatus TaxID=210409 RepID=A0A5B7J4G5_PORTR|nr:hypothetical protein [Portunus trituberculatus]
MSADLLPTSKPSANTDPSELTPRQRRCSSTSPNQQAPPRPPRGRREAGVCGDESRVVWEGGVDARHRGGLTAGT